MPGLSATWVLLLAAGNSSRFGSPKALAPWQNGTLISQAMAVSAAVVGPRILAVLGADSERLKSHVQALHSTVNEAWYHGMGSSIAIGLQAIREQDSQVKAVIILPVDQPLVSSQHLIQLAEACFQTGRIVLTANSSEMGPPACLPHQYFPKTLALNGLKGLKSSLTEKNHTTVHNPQALMDADTPEALKRLAGFL